MRKLLAVLLGVVFVLLLFVAVTVNQVVDTATEPEVVIGMINDAEAYDYVYDNIVGSAVKDIVNQGIEFDSGDGQILTLHFDDPDKAATAVTDLIETLVPREYFKGQFEESLRELVPYARGETDQFTVDLEVQERVRSVPGAVRIVVTELNLAESIVEDLLVPKLGEFSDQISDDALGISFSQAEIERNARLIFDPVWLEGQLFDAVDEITPYFAGDAESFSVVLAFDDRIVIVGDLLKDKLQSENTLYTMVFDQVVDPLVQQTTAQSNDVGFGIALTEQEVLDTFEVIAPESWVREQGENVIDALVDYMTGRSNSLDYTVDLSELKVAATSQLKNIARTKLETTISEIPQCSSPADLLGATQDLTSQQIPRCLAGGTAVISQITDTLGPIMDDQVELFVSNQIPDNVSYTLSDFESSVGGGFDTIEDARSWGTEGLVFTDQDLIDILADDGDLQSRADAEEVLQVFADGIAFTEQNILEHLTPEDRQLLDDVRGYVNTGLVLRWILWILMILPLLSIAFIGGRGWPGRLKWAGGVAFFSAVVIYALIFVAWSFNDAAKEKAVNLSDIAADFRDDFPKLAAELDSDEPLTRLERAMDAWQEGWRNQTVPWMIGGIVLFGIGKVLGVRGTGGAPKDKPLTTPSANPAATAGRKRSRTGPAMTVPKDWTKDENADSEPDESKSDEDEERT